MANLARRYVAFDNTMVDGNIGKRDGTNLARVSAVNEHFIVDDLVLSSFGNDAGPQEIGSTLPSWNFSWGYTGGPAIFDPTIITDLQITPIMGNMTNPIDPSLTSLPVTGAGLTSTQLFTISATTNNSANPGGGIITTNLSTTILFEYKRWWGAADTILTSGSSTANIKAVCTNFEFATSITGFDKHYNCTGGKYIYWLYPTAWPAWNKMYIGGFEVSGTTPMSIPAFESWAGYPVSYTLVMVDQIQNGSDIEVVLA